MWQSSGVLTSCVTSCSAGRGKVGFLGGVPLFPIRDENPRKRIPVVTISLIFLNVTVFLYSVLSGRFDQLIGEYGVRPAELLAGRGIHKVFTSMFLHGGVLHILFNMWYLWIFSDNVEGYFGHERYLLLYLGWGATAAIIHSVLDRSMIPAIGASGAISGVLGAYMVLYPWAKVYSAVVLFYFVRIVAVPAVLFLGSWFLLQAISASLTWMTGAATGVAYWAHIGGFLAGAVTALVARRFRRE